jgi:hypothetical protein
MRDILHEFARLIHLVLLLCGVVAVSGFLAEIIIAPMLTRLERLYRKRRAKRLEERLKDAASSCS